MSEEWGPWIDHDGAGGPKVTGVLSVEVEGTGKGPIEGMPMDNWHPSWFWRWKTVRVGWFRYELRRVCDNPAFAPIIRYRIRKPRALLKLIEMVENLPAKPKVPA